MPDWVNGLLIVAGVFAANRVIVYLLRLYSDISRGKE